MKKIILAVLTAFVLSNYSFAQDNNNSAKGSTNESRTFGIGLNLTGLLAAQGADLTGFNLTFCPSDNILLSAIFGLIHQGETTTTVEGHSENRGDDKTLFSVGAALDFILIKKFVPFSLGAEIVYNSLSEDDSRLDIGVMAGLHGEITSNVLLSGKVGPVFLKNSSESKYSESSRFDFALAYRIYLTWFAF